MNWHQVLSLALYILVSALLSTGFWGAIWAVIGKWYFDKKLETLKDELNQKRDSRQALISHSNYATEKSLELEFKAIEDIFAGIARLEIGMSNCRPRFDPSHPDEDAGIKRKRMMKPARELNNARNDFLRLIATTRLFYPESLYEAARACLQPVDDELVQIFVFEDDPFSSAGIEQADKNREQFYPRATQLSVLLRQRLAELKQLPA